MKQKKSEIVLNQELEKVQKIALQNPNLAEKKMNQLIKKALNVFKNETDPKMAQFYYEYGNILLSILEEKDNQEQAQDKEEEVQLISLEKENQENDREMKDAQCAWENLEAAKQIVQVQIGKLQAEYEELQRRMLQIRETKLQWQNMFLKNNKRLGDLYSWREDYNEAQEVYENVMNELKQNKCANNKEIAELHYKIGNVILLQGALDCEVKALQNFKTSFMIISENLKLEYQESDLNSQQTIDKIRKKLEQREQCDQVLLLLLLLEKIEDTVMQLQETKECQAEIQKWKNSNFKLNGDSQEDSQIQKQFSVGFEKQEKKELEVQLNEPQKVVFLGVYGSAKRQGQEWQRTPQQKQKKEDEQFTSFDQVFKKIKL